MGTTTSFNVTEEVTIYPIIIRTYSHRIYEGYIYFSICSVKCPCCGKIYNDKLFNIICHIERCGMYIYGCVKGKNMRRVFTECTGCSKKFDTNDFNKHIFYKKCKMVKCNYCNYRSFSSWDVDVNKEKVKEHQEMRSRGLIETGIINYKCPKCERWFDPHYKDMHPRDLNTYCEWCLNPEHKSILPIVNYTLPPYNPYN